MRFTDKSAIFDSKPINFKGWPESDSEYPADQTLPQL